jgi:hypothetical protein
LNLPKQRRAHFLPVPKRVVVSTSAQPKVKLKTYFLRQLLMLKQSLMKNGAR